MKAGKHIVGIGILLVSGSFLSCSKDCPKVGTAEAAISISSFDPFRLPKAEQEPWLDPFVFFSDKAYTVNASPTAKNAPTTEASFIGGKDKMISYLKANIVPSVTKGIGWLKPPVVNFSVNTLGAVESVELVETSGNAGLDEQMVKVIEDMPRWKPAQSADGKVVSQPFEFKVIQAACDQKPPIPPTLSVSMYEVPLLDRQIAMEHPYDLNFSVKKAGEGQYVLITTMGLHGGSFYVSPNSKRDVKGKFLLEVANQDHLILEEKFREIPRSKEVIDLHPFVNGAVDWVSEDTKYEHTLTVTSKEDFDIGGKYQFTIEPKCTMEVIPFMIKYRSGVLTIEKWKC
ncbi:MAG TPA: energy transducer TonB [Flavobacteriales bacterium]|nr:energy transducer TonB [Flavobacteriales bacterium]